MTASLDALVVRAAGHAAHLLDPAGRAALLRAGDFPALARELGAHGYAVPDPRPEAPALELAIRRGAGARLRQLARWEPGEALGRLLFALEDQRSLRALVRGAAAGLPADARLAGLLPTPTLPERVQAELARLPSVAAMAALLAAWRSPFAAALRPARAGHPDLLMLDVALARTAGEMVRQAARRLGGDWRGFVRETTDLDNLCTALLLMGRGGELLPASLFLPGGESLTLEGCTRIAGAAPDQAGVLLPRLLGGTPLAALLPPEIADPATLERDLDDLRRQAWRRRARRDPLGAAPVVSYLLALRAEVVFLQRAVWGVALGAPPLRRDHPAGTT